MAGFRRFAPALALSLLASNAFAETWREAPIWDDGKAEFSVYDVVWARYSELHAGEATLILVKEPWAPDLDVKADTARPDGFEVIKLNHLRTVPTGIYTYHQMASGFFTRSEGTLVKLAASSFEACGLTSAEMVDGQLSTSSYFDGQGHQSAAWQADWVAADLLPLVLRDFVSAEVLPETLEVFPSVLTGRLPALRPIPMTLERTSKPTSLETRAGTFEVVTLKLTPRGSQDPEFEYSFEFAPPHRLIEYAAADGTRYSLAKTERLAYWALNRVGDQEWLPAPK